MAYEVWNVEVCDVPWRHDKNVILYSRLNSTFYILNAFDISYYNVAMLWKVLYPVSRYITVGV